jgi:hypothetical protein
MEWIWWGVEIENAITSIMFIALFAFVVVCEVVMRLDSSSHPEFILTLGIVFTERLMVYNTTSSSSQHRKDA